MKSKMHGWLKEESEASLQAAIAHAYVVDYKGRQGAAHYWVEQYLKRTRDDYIFEDGTMDETSDVINHATQSI